ncbi:MAG: HDIG domain-containing protein [Thermoplasmata archaeon]|nr:MAG: HDIG domain-containing protein [Thermoplasmata archaeon]MCD6468215.1 HDIG domain-containing protein [Thermoplasmata archaeon]RLF26994.1 MAG: phosphohydrolase [Thermoplasmata archaeon]HHH79355.1 HDIG domain-containing protein [Thermoplasmatales archaeon]
MIERDDALNLVKRYLKKENMVKHSLAVEAIMRELAKALERDEELWGLTGLLHDLDYEYTSEDPNEHGIVTCQVLEGLLPEEGLDAIKAHNYQYTGKTPIHTLEKALIAADAVSGLIIATALVMPSKKLADVKIETLLKKFDDKTFAKGCDRRRISICYDFGVTLRDFLQISLKALQGIASDLGL